MKSPLVKSLISLLQKCTLKGRSQRLVGKQPTLTVLIVLTNIFFSSKLYTLFSNRKRLQFHSNQEPNPGLYPGNPASEQVSHSHLSQPLSAFVYLHYKITTKVSFSILAQSLVHTKPEPDWEAVGERHPQPLSVCGHYYPGAHLRVSEASWQVN